MKMLHIAMIIVLAFVMVFVGTDYAYAQYGCPPVSGGWDPKIASSNDTVHVIWNYFYGCGQRVLLLRTSTDGGNSFGDPVTVADTTETGSEPVVAASNSNVYVAWIRFHVDPEQVLFKKSTDNGKSFGNAIMINNDKTGENSPYLAAIIGQGNNIGIIWSGYVINGSGSSVFLSKSLDGGSSFQTINLSATTGDSFSPQVTQAGNKAYVLWGSAGSCDRNRHECPAYSYVETIDPSNSFALGPITGVGQYGGKIASSGNNVYIVGAHNSGDTSTIELVQSTDGGISFAKPIIVASYPSSTNHLSGVAVNVSGKNVYVTWYDFNSIQTGSEILMRASNDGGATFGNTQVLDWGDHHLNGPEPPNFDINTVSQGDNYYALWQSNTGLDQIGQGVFLSKSTDGGMTLDNATDLTGRIVISNPGYDFVSDGKSLYIAGPDYAFKDGNHVVFSKSSDGGNTFSGQIDLDQDSVSSVPEFPFAVPVLVIGATSIVIFTRLKFKLKQ